MLKKTYLVLFALLLVLPAQTWAEEACGSEPLAGESYEEPGLLEGEYGWDPAEAEYNSYLDGYVEEYLWDEEQAEEYPVEEPELDGSYPGSWYWPWPTGHGRYITCGYGQGLHQGQDYHAIDWNLAGTADCKTPVHAPRAGTIKFAGWQGGYGNTIVVESIDGNYLYRVAHLHSICVVPGQYVKRGKKIGTVGDTGISEGCHLHFVVYRGSYSGGGHVDGYSVPQNGIDGDWDLRVGWWYYRR